MPAPPEFVLDRPQPSRRWRRCVAVGRLSLGLALAPIAALPVLAVHSEDAGVGTVSTVTAVVGTVAVLALPASIVCGITGFVVARRLKQAAPLSAVLGIVLGLGGLLAVVISLLAIKASHG